MGVPDKPSHDTHGPRQCRVGRQGQPPVECRVLRRFVQSGSNRLRLPLLHPRDTNTSNHYIQDTSTTSRIHPLHPGSIHYIQEATQWPGCSLQSPVYLLQKLSLVTSLPPLLLLCVRSSERCLWTNNNNILFRFLKSDCLPLYCTVQYSTVKYSTVQYSIV